MHKHNLFALLLVGAAFVLSVVVSGAVFERLPHLEDEIAYLFQARIFARGDVVVETPQPRSPYWQPFIVDYNGNRFGKYTPGWPALLAVGVWMGQSWIVNAWFAALTVAVTYRLGKEVFLPDVGLMAAFLMAVSPMFLLLNGTLMSHTAALFAATLFLYGYWRLEVGSNVVGWGGVAGLGLGMLVAIRPLTAIGVAAPFILYSAGRVILSLFRRNVWRTLAPLLVLSALTVLFGLTIPLFRYVATGDPLLNTYTLIWEYDRVGFGEDVGRSGHTLERGLRNARWDLSLAAADLFGWQIEPFNDEMREFALTRAHRWPGTGFSWVLLPMGLIAGVLRRQRWTVLLAVVPLCVIGVHLAYWIGSQRYSTRYYFEALSAVVLLSAVAPGWLAARWRRWPVYMALFVITTWGAITYTIPRLSLLHGFNGVTRADIAEVEARRETDRPALVIIYGEGMTWRAHGTLTTITGPYLDGDIVLARDTTSRLYYDAIVTRFPDREIIEMVGQNSESWFLDEPPTIQPETQP